MVSVGPAPVDEPAPSPPLEARSIEAAPAEPAPPAIAPPAPRHQGALAKTQVLELPPIDAPAARAPEARPALAAPAASTSRSPSVPDHPTEPAVLLVGFEPALCEALTAALGRHSVFVEAVEPGSVVSAVTVAAPDLVVLMGDGGREDTRALLDELAASPLSSVVPVALVTDDPALGARLEAFRHGAAAVVPKSASVSALAERVNQLAREIPERGEAVGRVGEATLRELVDTLAHELRSGILSVKQGDSVAEAEQKSVRLVLGRGRPLATLIDEFVARVRSQIEHAEPLLYEFDERAMGTVELLTSDFDDEGRAVDVSGLRVILADDDSARADAVAQVLRGSGAHVVVTDLEPSPAHLGRLRQLDPMVLVIGDSQLRGPGYRLVRTLREHRRLRWASLLVVHWDELWSEERGVPHTSVLLSRLMGLSEPERVIAARLAMGAPFDTRLEALGPARLLRALVGEGPLRVTIRNPRYYVQISIAEGLVAGAVGFTQAGARLEGPQALAALLNLGSGRVHVEPGRGTNATNLLATVDVALGMAEGEEATIPESIPAPPPSDLPPALPRIATQPAGLLRDDDADRAFAPEGLVAPRLPAGLTPEGAPQLAPGVVPMAKEAQAMFAPQPAASAELLSDGSLSAPQSVSLRPPSASPRHFGLSRSQLIWAGVGALGALVAALTLIGWGLSTLLESRAATPVLVTAADEQPPAAEAPASPEGSTASPGAERSPTPATQAKAAPAVKEPSAKAPSTASPVAKQAPSGALSAAGRSAEEPASSGKVPDTGSAAKPASSGDLPVPERRAVPSCETLVAGVDPPVGAQGAAQREVDRAKRAIVAGDLARAQLAYCQALTLAPGDARAASGLGLVLMMRGDGEQAVTYLKRALEGDADNPTRLLLGDALALAGRYPEAREAWLAASGVPATNSAAVEREAHVHQTKGDEALARRDHLRAERLYRRAVVLSPARVEAGVKLARALLLVGRKQEAVSFARWATEARPGARSGWLMLSEALTATGDAEGARAAAAKAK
ncbi:MAG: tetratricopeptide repeat protein [Polyangiaceae bacterium]|nr:tetratricopeptide repeat protein [Polyangiaceae bacterium]